MITDPEMKKDPQRRNKTRSLRFVPHEWLKTVQGLLPDKRDIILLREHRMMAIIWAWVQRRAYSD